MKIVDAGTMTRVKQEVVGALGFIQEMEKGAFEKNILKGKYKGKEGSVANMK